MSNSVVVLNVSTRCGFRPNVRQIRTIAVCDNPVASAMLRVLQCVAFLGMDSNVRTTTSSTCLSVSVRGAPAIQDIVDGVLDELTSAHTGAGSVGKAIGMGFQKVSTADGAMKARRAYRALVSISGGPR